VCVRVCVCTNAYIPGEEGPSGVGAAAMTSSHSIKYLEPLYHVQQDVCCVCVFVCVCVCARARVCIA